MRRGWGRDPRADTTDCCDTTSCTQWYYVNCSRDAPVFEVLNFEKILFFQRCSRLTCSLWNGNIRLCKVAEIIDNSPDPYSMNPPSLAASPTHPRRSRDEWVCSYSCLPLLITPSKLFQYYTAFSPKVYWYITAVLLDSCNTWVLHSVWYWHRGQKQRWYGTYVSLFMFLSRRASTIYFVLVAKFADGGGRPIYLAAVWSLGAGRLCLALTLLWCHKLNLSRRSHWDYYNSPQSVIINIIRHKEH